MEIVKKTLPKGQIELNVEVTPTELEPYLEQAAAVLSQTMPIEGFRPGKAPYAVMKAKVGAVPLLEEAARILLDKKMAEILTAHITGEIVDQPQVNITRLAPDNALGFAIIVTLLPEVTLGEYKNLSIKQDQVQIAEEKISQTLDWLKQSRAKEVRADRPAALGDKVIVDLKMFLDKVPLENGQSTNTAVVLGADYLVPGFDQQLIGLTSGQSKTFTITYPTAHHQANLAGRTVEFQVMVKDVFARELPDWTDELAQSFGGQTVQALRDNIVAHLTEEEALRVKQKAELAMLETIVRSSQFADLPDNLIDNEIDLMLQELDYHLNAQGAKLEDYLQSVKQTKETLRAEFKPQALKRLQTALVIQKISHQENIIAAPEAVEQEIKHLLEHYADNQAMRNRLQSPAYRRRVASQLIHNQTLAKLREWNIT